MGLGGPPRGKGVGYSELKMKERVGGILEVEFVLDLNVAMIIIISSYTGIAFPVPFLYCVCSDSDATFLFWSNFFSALSALNHILLRTNFHSILSQMLFKSTIVRNISSGICFCRICVELKIDVGFEANPKGLGKSKIQK